MRSSFGLRQCCNLFDGQIGTDLRSATTALPLWTVIYSAKTLNQVQPFPSQLKTEARVHSSCRTSSPFQTLFFTQLFGWTDCLQKDHACFIALPFSILRNRSQINSTAELLHTDDRQTSAKPNNSANIQFVNNSSSCFLSFSTPNREASKWLKNFSNTNLRHSNKSSCYIWWKQQQRFCTHEIHWKF